MYTFIYAFWEGSPPTYILNLYIYIDIYIYIYIYMEISIRAQREKAIMLLYIISTCIKIIMSIYHINHDL